MSLYEPNILTISCSRREIAFVGMLQDEADSILI